MASIRRWAANNRLMMKSRTHLMVTVASLVGLLVLAAGCSSGGTSPGASGASAPSTTGVDVRRAEGRPVEGLDFTVPSSAAEDAKPGATTAIGGAGAVPAMASDRAVVTAFLDRAVDGDFDGAFGYLSGADRVRLGGPSVLAEQFATGQWTSFSAPRADSDADEGDVTVEVVQTARINEIVGLVSSTATVVLPTIAEKGSQVVSWTRRQVDQHFPPRSAATDSAVREAVNEWARSRQQCAAPTHEYAYGLLGVVGLGDALCRKDGTPVAGAVGDLDALDEPEPIIEGFGGAALSWARVVTLDGPVPMRVVVAPVGDGWIVIGLARTTLAAP